MNALLWISQIALAAVFLITGGSKIVARNAARAAAAGDPRSVPLRLTPMQDRFVGLLEMAGAVGVVMPESVTPVVLAEDYLLIRLAAGGLALLMAAAALYHARRRESAASPVAALLLALVVVVGRWPL